MNIDAVGLELWKICANKLTITTTTEFLQGLKNLLLEKANVKIDENQEKFIREKVDPGFKGVVNLAEFSIFYDNFWRHPSERNRFFRLKFPEEKEKTVDDDTCPFVLLKIVERDNEIGPPPFSLPSKFEIKVFPNILKTIDKTRKPIKLTNKVSVGSDENSDIVLGKKNKMLPGTQFALFFSNEAVFIKDYPKTSRTVLRVAASPVVLALDMVIRIGLNTILAVTAVSPLSRKSTSKGKNFIFFTPEEEEPEEIYQNVKLLAKGERFLDVSSFRAKRKSLEDESMRFQELQKKELLLECVEGPEKGQIYYFNFLQKDGDFSIGRADYHDIILSDITVSLKHCLISYDKEVGWFLKEDAVKPSYFGTYVYFANQKQHVRATESYPQILPPQGVLSFSNYDVYFKTGRKKKGDKNYVFARKK